MFCFFRKIFLFLHFFKEKLYDKKGRGILMSFTWGDEILNCECNHEPVTTLIYLLQKQIQIQQMKKYCSLIQFQLWKYKNWQEIKWVMGWHPNVSTSRSMEYQRAEDKFPPHRMHDWSSIWKGISLKVVFLENTCFLLCYIK